MHVWCCWWRAISQTPIKIAFSSFFVCEWGVRSCTRLCCLLLSTQLFTRFNPPRVAKKWGVEHEKISLPTIQSGNSRNIFSLIYSNIKQAAEVMIVDGTFMRGEDIYAMLGTASWTQLRGKTPDANLDSGSSNTSYNPPKHHTQGGIYRTRASTANRHVTCNCKKVTMTHQMLPSFIQKLHSSLQ
jgi:hypothetical protein